MQSRRYNQYDLNRNRIPDADYDGMPEADGVRYPGVQPNGLDDDGDGVIDDDGDSGSRNRAAVPSSFTARAADGDFYYDPEPEIDEEYANGKDDDRDGLIDEDVRLASVRVLEGWCGCRFSLEMATITMVMVKMMTAIPALLPGRMELITMVMEGLMKALMRKSGTD